MRVVWILLIIFSGIAAIWYFKSILNPHGRMNYPPLLWNPTGHFVIWIILAIGVVAVFMLVR